MTPQPAQYGGHAGGGKTYHAAGARAVEQLAARMTAALGAARPPRLTARLTFRQWADAVDSGRMPVIRALLRDSADLVWTVMQRGGSR
jgi:hypothetical protein